MKGNVYGPISLNAYLYCDNQSMNYIDLNGLHREDIKEYADEYADLDNPKRNPRFPAYPPKEGNCANFVSQCMFFAGVPMNDKWYCFEPEEGVIEGFIIKLGLKMYKPNGDPRYEHMIYNRTLLTDTWNCADAQYKYFTDSKNGFINNKDTDVTKVSSLEELNNVNDLQVGDLLYWDFDGDGKMDHASIVVDGDEGNIKFAANTTDYSDKLVSAGYQEGNDLYFVRLRDCVYD